MDNIKSPLNLEENHLKAGFYEATKRKSSLRQGRSQGSGLEKSFEVGEELGFSRGWVEVWNSIVRVDPAWFSYRIQEGIKQMEELIVKYPVMDPENMNVQEIMDGLRLKFKFICASMGAKLDCNGYPKSSLQAKEIEF